MLNKEFWIRLTLCNVELTHPVHAMHNCENVQLIYVVSFGRVHACDLLCLAMLRQSKMGAGTGWLLGLMNPVSYEPISFSRDLIRAQD